MKLKFQVGSPEDKDVKENGVAHFLTNPTRETPNAYQIGSISIPKGDPPSDKQLKAFQEAQLAIGGSEKQIDILTRAQIGILPAAYERAHPTPAEFLKKVQIDPKTGDASVGNLHFGASDWPAYKDMILNNGSKDPQLMGSLEKLANSQNSETTLGESVISKPNPSGEHLLANFRPDEHGDMHYKNATIRKEDYPLLAESLTKSPKDVAFIEAEAAGGDFLDQEENQDGAHTVVGKALPHFRQEECGEAARVSEYSRSQIRPRLRA